MDLDLFKKLHASGLIAESSLKRVETTEQSRLFSVHWELKTLLYLGVLLLSSGLGVLVYKNIDTIGHQAIIGFIILLSGACYYYCFRHKLPFSAGKVPAPNAFFDYVLLLGCLAMVTAIGYLQFQYTLFGRGLGLASFIPMVLLFLTAYYFDHIGVLSLAITNLAAWMGISVTPMTVLSQNDFSDHRLIYTGLALGLLLILAAWASERRAFKAHFAFTYTNFGIHLLFISALAGMFTWESRYLLWFLLVLAMGWYFYRMALRQGAYYFMVVDLLYAYIALSYVVVRLLESASQHAADMDYIYIMLLYFILSAIGLVRVLMILNRKMKRS